MGFFIIRSGLRTTIFCVGRAKRRACSLFSVYQETGHKWLTITADELILRRSAYWPNFREHDETEIKSSITVHIPEQNLFNVDNLRMLMEQSRKGSIQ